MIDMCVKHGWSRDKFTLIPNSVTFDKEQRAKSKEQNSEYVAYTGRLSEEKGLSVLLETAVQLPQFKFRIAGEGSMQAYIESFIKEHKLTNVELVGFLAGEALFGFIKQASLVVVPSVWYENNSLAILEAMANSKVVLASKIGGIPEMLPEQLLFEPGNARQLSDLIVFWMNQSSEKKLAQGQELQNIVRQNNSPAVYFDKVLAVYKRFIA
jgi:glycosyltransferase involved in cell wall biosynthesis